MGGKRKEKKNRQRKKENQSKQCACAQPDKDRQRSSGRRHRGPGWQKTLNRPLFFRRTEGLSSRPWESGGRARAPTALWTVISRIRAGAARPCRPGPRNKGPFARSNMGHEVTRQGALGMGKGTPACRIRSLCTCREACWVGTL